MLGAYGCLVRQAELYPRCVIVEGSRTRINYIAALEFVPEATNCAVILVFIAVLALVVVLILVPCF